jgi:hypothetical protein
MFDTKLTGLQAATLIIGGWALFVVVGAIINVTTSVIHATIEY